MFSPDGNLARADVPGSRPARGKHEERRQAMTVHGRQDLILHRAPDMPCSPSAGLRRNASRFLGRKPEAVNNAVVKETRALNRHNPVNQGTPGGTRTCDTRFRSRCTARSQLAPALVVAALACGAYVLVATGGNGEYTQSQ